MRYTIKMRNIKKPRKVPVTRNNIINRPNFRLGYEDALLGNPYRFDYDDWSSNEQRWYETGRLVAVALLSRNAAPAWRKGVKCPRDLPRLTQEVISYAIPQRPVSASR